jgi:hypothetical protein
MAFTPFDLLELVVFVHAGQRQQHVDAGRILAAGRQRSGDAVRAELVEAPGQGAVPGIGCGARALDHSTNRH